MYKPKNAQKPKYTVTQVLRVVECVIHIQNNWLTSHLQSTFLKRTQYMTKKDELER